jgi:hypothetical protein
VEHVDLCGRDDADLCDPAVVDVTGERHRVLGLAENERQHTTIVSSLLVQSGHERPVPRGAPAQTTFRHVACVEYPAHEKGETMIWLIVLLLVLFALVGGLAVSKFLLILLLVAIALAVFGAFGRTA